MTYLRTTFSSPDPEESEQWLAGVYGRVRLDRGFGRFTQRLARDDDFLVASSHWDGVIGSTVELDWIVVASATAASPWWSRDGQGDLAAAPALFCAGVPYVAQNHRGSRLAAFDTASLQRTARLVYGDDSLVASFDGSDPVTPAAGAQWLTTLQLVQDLADSGMLENDFVRASAARLLKVAALEAFRLRGDPRQRALSAEHRLRVYRRGAEFLREHASLPITVDDAAEATGASVPELVEAFRAYDPRAESPAAALQRARLEGAFTDLRAGDPTRGDTVRGIAVRWGFTSPGRFAGLIRATYGVNPKDLLDG